MTNLDPEICLRLKTARKAAKISQIDLANEIGCKQSALSMFEQGDGTKLNDEVIRRFAEKFGVDLDAKKKESAAQGDVPRPSLAVRSQARGYCPNPRCPSNRAYDVEGRTFYQPDRAAADPVFGKFCALCGETLIKACPNCGAPVHDGGFCSLCGEPYIATP